MSDYLRDKVNFEVYRYAVGKQMVCPVTGAVLDVRTAIVIESSGGERIISVVSPEGWAERRDVVLAKSPDLHIVDLAAL